MAKPIPDLFHTLTPHIIVNDGVAALDFYKQAFGATETFRLMGPDGKNIMHAQMHIGTSMLMLAGEFPPDCLSPKSRGGTSVFLHIYTEDADSFFNHAVKAGCKPLLPMADTFWGDRYGQIEDPFGHKWSIATHKQDLTKEQLAADSKEFCEKMARR